MLNAKKFIPSLFTILNAFCGFYSIVESSAGNFETSAVFIVYASLFDMLDGIIARILKTSSDFGVELDSLSDVISFGAAPSFLVYSIYLKELNSIGLVISSMILIFAAIRLARFNVELVGYEKDKFYGLPTPLSAITIVAFIIPYYNIIFREDTSNFIIASLSILLPVLMVSKFQYPVLPNFSLQSFKKHKLLFITLFIIIIVSLITKGISVFPFCILYILSGIILSLYKKFSRIFGVYRHKN